MKKKIIALSLLLTIVLPAIVVLAAYTSNILILNTSATSYDMVAGYSTANVTFMSTNGIFTSANGTDTRVKYGTTDQAFMLATDRITYATAIGAHASKTLVFSTGNNATATFSVVTGYGGYVTTNDTANLELGNNGSIPMVAWVDTTAGASKYIVRKQDALYGFVSYNTTGNITFQIVSSNETLWPDGAGDETGITNLVGAATHWQAESDNSTGSFVYTSNTSYERDLYTIGNPAGTDVIRDVTVYLRYGTSVPANPAYIKAVWKIGGTVYLGSENPTTANETLLTQEYTISPATGNPWTIAELTVAQLGASLHADGGATAQLYDEYAVIHYVRQVSVAGISSGERIVTPHLDGVNFWLTVDSTSSTNVTAPTVPDNGNPYIFGSNTVAYFDSIKLIKSGTERLWYQPLDIVKHNQLTDRDSTKDGDITWGAFPSGVTANMSGLVSDYDAGAGSSGDGQDVVPVNNAQHPTTGDAAKDTILQNDPLYGIWDAIDTAVQNSNPGASFPPLLQMEIMTLVLALLAFVIVYAKFAHLLIAGVAFCIPFGYRVAQHTMEWWVIPILVLWLIGCAIMENRQTVG